MAAGHTIRRWNGRALPACGLSMAAALLLAPGMVASAQDASRAPVAPMEERTLSAPPVASKLPAILAHTTIVQHLDGPLPLDAVFRDETGKEVPLGTYFGKKPAILALVYYRCPMLCSEELNGLIGALDMVRYTPGKDFNVIVASFDPNEGPALAAEAKAKYVKRYGRLGTAAGWHFLTGSQASIDALTKAVGFDYVRVPGPDGKADQFAHASSVELITTQGKIAQYYLGVEYPPNEIQKGLAAAAHGQIGVLVNLIYTYCYEYSPYTAPHSMVVVRIVQGGCLLTMLALGGFILISLRQEALRGDNAGAGKKANG